jgi:hypothetical protein
VPQVAQNRCGFQPLGTLSRAGETLSAACQKGKKMPQQGRSSSAATAALLSFMAKKNGTKKTRTKSTNQNIWASNIKRRGEAVEAVFLGKAALLGFVVAKPWGESHRYDLIVDSGRFLRIQVKCTTCFSHSRYCLSLKNNGLVYTADDIDFLAVYVLPKDTWYLLPVEMVAGKSGLELAPGIATSMYEPYREAWPLLASPPKTVGRKHIPKPRPCPEVSVRCATCPLGK